jgi:hypothetical protein
MYNFETLSQYCKIKFLQEFNVLQAASFYRSDCGAVPELEIKFSIPYSQLILRQVPSFLK